jgi:hypothetical protein
MIVNFGALLGINQLMISQDWKWYGVKKWRFYYWFQFVWRKLMLCGVFGCIKSFDASYVKNKMGLSL